MREDEPVTLAVNVAGGTNAGCKKPFAGKTATAWVCGERHWNSGYFSTCVAPGCREKRPKP